MSPRSKGRIIKINCAALPRELIESELFGSVKGAFTGAHSDREGLFRQAEGGTLFLDEISEMPVDTQSKLLRVLQDQEVRPVGGKTELQDQLPHHRRHQPQDRGSHQGRQNCGKICFTVSARSPSTCRHCASGARTSCRWRPPF